MRKTIDLILLIGFVVVDWLLFHDFFKPGETYTPVEYLIGALSILVFINSLRSLFRR